MAKFCLFGSSDNKKNWKKIGKKIGKIPKLSMEPKCGSH